MIGPATVNQVREASDLASVVGETVELRPSGGELRGLCPFHDDTHPSLCVNSEKQRWYCHPCGKHGDVFAWIMARDNVAFPEAVHRLAQRAGVNATPASRAISRFHTGVTVADFARAKGFDRDLLAALGITDGIWKARPAVYFPYFLSAADAVPVAVRIRRTLEKRSDIPRFEWRKGDSPIPYGLWCLSTSGAKERGVIHLVEGESDFIALLHQNIPALGVPGNYWREEWSRYLDGTERILVAVEPDSGGERLVESLAKSSLWSRCSMMLLKTVVPVLEGVVS